MAVLYELLAGSQSQPATLERSSGRGPQRPGGGMSMATERLFHRTDGRPASCCIRRVHVLDPAQRDRRRARHPDPRRGDRRARRPGLAAGARRTARRSTATGKHAFPAFVDPHVHLRTPGQEYKENIDTGTAAAAAGGFCAVIAMPNTDPVVDDVSVLRSLVDGARREARVPVGFMAAITRGLQGEVLTEMAALRDAGALGFTDDGKPVVSAGMLRKALQYQRLCGGVIALHEEDPGLSGDGVMHEGAVSARLGVTGIPSVSESTMVARDAALALFEDARVHFQHLSCVESVHALEQAKRLGARVSAEATPHHLTLTDDVVRTLDSRFKMNPPLRAESDRRALIDALRSGVIDTHRDRPRPARPPREGGPLRAGADGHDRSGDRVRSALHGARPAGRASIST